MNLDLVPEHLPVIAARLGISAADLMQMLSSAVPAALPLQPGLDDVSAMIPQAFAKHAQLFFPSTTDGVAGGAAGAAALPDVSVAYVVSDIDGGLEVHTTGVKFGK
ncbi:hypothetical protein OG874_22390 [Nocardia sp. NBC_00565]|uniref:hypothetical protein n=1 Tax=Nocardia sp. NBC_00565 TaxID=2975993 RepID=UPI002E8163C0|nr:hypothetical protein [Nocardia sp. NBC_00565]WUC07668.1 hypothetical protein OG874_22390 [Nocardia sp. NBC_00565]